MFTWLEAEAATFAGKAAGLMLGSAMLFSYGFYQGDTHRGKVDGAADAKARIEFLQRQLDAGNAAAKDFAAQSDADKARIAELESKSNDAIGKTSNAVCLDGDDAGWLRSIWGAGPAHTGKH